MAQFDVHRVDGRLVVDLQSDIIGLDNTRLVAPLREYGRYAFLLRLTPKVVFQEEVLIVRIMEMAAIPSATLGPVLGSLESYRDDIKRAIDLLIDGI